MVHVKLGSLWEKQISLIYRIEICSVRTGLEEFLHWTELVGIYGPSLPRLQYLKGFLPRSLNIQVECIFDSWLTKTKNVNFRIALCFYLSALTPFIFGIHNDPTIKMFHLQRVLWFNLLIFFVVSNWNIYVSNLSSPKYINKW